MPPSLVPWLSGGPAPPQPPQPSQQPLTAPVSNPLGDAFRQGATPPVVGPTPRRMSSALPIEAPSPSLDEELSFQTVKSPPRRIQIVKHIPGMKAQVSERQLDTAVQYSPLSPLRACSPSKLNGKDVLYSDWIIEGAGVVGPVLYADQALCNASIQILMSLQG